MMLRIVLTIGISLLGALAVADPGVEKPEFSRPDSRSWVVMVTQPTCSFCTRLEKEILQPLRASGQFADRVRFTTVDIGVAGPLVDFDGSRTTTTQFANLSRIWHPDTALFKPSG